MAKLVPLALFLLLFFPSAATALDPPRIPEDQAVHIAEGDPNAVEAKREHPDLHPSAQRSDNDGDGQSDCADVMDCPLGTACQRNNGSPGTCQSNRNCN